MPRHGSLSTIQQTEATARPDADINRTLCRTQIKTIL